MTSGTLVLMGSGETTPTMVTTHQKLFATTEQRSGGGVDAVLLDTPYGFQENAAEISDKAKHYFAHHVGRDVRVVRAGRLDRADALAVESTLDAVRRADWLFSGPGSPTYAIGQWSTAGFADAFAAIVDGGGTVVLASAAAVTTGTRTIPVYEIYKAGVVPSWAPGLGVVEQVLGWRCVVIPHFDNAEGGTHDTRYCYLGRRRLELLEADLDADEWVLGIDEHTAAILDLDAGTMRVEGRGGVHVRRDGLPVASWAAGDTVSLVEVGSGTANGTVVIDDEPASGLDGAEPAPTPMDEQVAALARAFDTALDDLDADGATRATLDLEELIRAWGADTQESDEHDRAVRTLRGMLTRLGRLAGEGMHDHRELVRPHIETLLHVREDARTRKAFEVADHIRVHMDADGVRVRDTHEGTEWDWDEPDLSPPEE